MASFVEVNRANFGINVRNTERRQARRILRRITNNFTAIDTHLDRVLLFLKVHSILKHLCPICVAQQGNFVGKLFGLSFGRFLKADSARHRAKRTNYRHIIRVWAHDNSKLVLIIQKLVSNCVLK